MILDMPPLPEATRALLVAPERALSDQQDEGFVALACWFHEAHRQAPGGLSIEIGTRHGGSAWLCLKILETRYPDPALRPALFTVDPYGGKPYYGGDGVFWDIYGDADYTRAKNLLAGFPNHAHFLLTGESFFGTLLGATYWRNAREHTIDQLTFVFLDGDHDARTVIKELTVAWDTLAPGGIILIDNVDKAPGLSEQIVKFCSGAKAAKFWRSATQIALMWCP